MSFSRLCRLLKPALLCGTLAAPGLVGTMAALDTGECGGSAGGSASTSTSACVEVQDPVRTGPLPPGPSGSPVKRAPRCGGARRGRCLSFPRPGPWLPRPGPRPAAPAVPTAPPCLAVRGPRRLALRALYARVLSQGHRRAHGLPGQVPGLRVHRDQRGLAVRQDGRKLYSACRPARPIC